MDEDKKKLPRLPKIGEYVRSNGVLVEVQTFQPPPEPKPESYQEYIFEENCARNELRYRDGSVIKTLDTFNDFYGFGTGEETAIKELKEFVESKGIDEKSDIEAVVVREVHLCKTVVRDEPNFYDKDFYRFTQVSTRLKSEIDVWSSRKGDMRCMIQQ